MNKKLNWKAWSVGILTVFAVLQLLPTFSHYKDAKGVEKSYLPDIYTQWFDKQISYGLDLKGGLELRYTVDYKKAIGDNTFRLRDSVLDRLGDAYATAQKKEWATLSDAEKKPMLDRFVATRTAFNTLKVDFKFPEDQKLLDSTLVSRLDDRFELRTADKMITLFMPDKAVNKLKNEIVDQTLSVIRKRVDAFGLVEPDVRKSGDADIDLQLPGLSDRQMRMVRERVGQAAQLTFRMVRLDAKVFDDKGAAVTKFKADHPDAAKSLTWNPDSRGAYLKADKKSEILKFVKTLQEEKQVPDDVLIGYEFFDGKNDGNGDKVEKYWRTYNLTGKTELTGDNLTRAGVGSDQKNSWVVNLEFDSRGAKTFGDLTEKNVGNLMAIMLDDDVSSAPRINEAIRGGRAQITLGRGTSAKNQLDEARSLVTVLNNGAYKAPVIKVHDIEVGPSLGADAVKSGLVSMFVGVLLVVLFMALYYRQGGLIANAALVLNLLLQLACLVSFNAALTLPGMAGLTLTTAMAVDANILIFERIREELRLGRTVRNALDLGYGRAFWTIFDSHITAGMAGAVLMMYSNGPIYGFAVTLLIGIGTSMFTSIVATRLVYDYLLDRGKLKQLSV